MVIFDHLIISEDGREIQIKAHVDSNEYFKDEHIQQLCIDTDKTFVSCGISSTPIYNKVYKESIESSEPEAQTDNTPRASENSLDNIIEFDARSGIGTMKKPAVFNSSTGTLSFTLDNADEDGGDNDTPEQLVGVKEINETIRIEDPALFTFDGKTFNDNLFFVYIKTNGIVGNAPCALSSSLNMAVVYKSDRFFNTILNISKTLKDCVVPKDFLNFAILYDLFKSCLDYGYINKAIELFHKLVKTSTTKRKGGCGCGRNYS